MLTNREGEPATTGDPGNGNNGFWGTYSPTVIDGQFKYLNNSAPLYVGGPVTVFGKFTYSGNAHPYSGGLVTHGHSNIS